MMVAEDRDRIMVTSEAGGEMMVTSEGCGEMIIASDQDEMSDKMMEEISTEEMTSTVEDMVVARSSHVRTSARANLVMTNSPSFTSYSEPLQKPTLKVIKRPASSTLGQVFNKVRLGGDGGGAQQMRIVTQGEQAFLGTSLGGGGGGQTVTLGGQQLRPIKFG